MQELKNKITLFVWSGRDCNTHCLFSWKRTVCSCKCFLPPNAAFPPQACAVIRIPPLNLSALCRFNKAIISNNGSNYKYVQCSELNINILKMKNAVTHEFFWNNTGRNGQVCMAINIKSTELTLFRARVWWAFFWKTLGSFKAWEHKRSGKYQNIIICYGDTQLFFMACKNILTIPDALRCRSACLWQMASAQGSIAKRVGNGSA